MNRPGEGVSDFRQYYSSMPLSFEAGVGDGIYRARGLGYGLAVGSDQAVFTFDRNVGEARVNSRESQLERPERPALKERLTPTVFRMNLAGANKDASAEPAGLQSGRTNYLIGNDPKLWRTNLPNYSRVKYRSVYENIDLVWYGNQRRLEYDFEIAPAADPSKIRLAFDNSASLSLDVNGDLIIRSSDGTEMRQKKPVAWQIIGGRQIEVAANYDKVSEHEIAFALGEYDSNETLIIDPVLIFSTFLGGNNDEFGNGIAADTDGNTYVTGVTYSADYPVKSPYQIQLRGIGNAWVAKFDASGQLVYSTFLGGESEDVGFAINIDSARNAYIAGSTDSSNFPIAGNAYQYQLGGRIDGFVSKLNAKGDTLIYSTYLGGSSDDIVNHIVVDASNNAYAVGETLSANFPTLNGYQSQLSGIADAFLTKINAAGSALVYSTLLGGKGRDTAFSVAIDGSNNPYVAGFTYSVDFPTKTPIQATLASSVDAFVTKFNSSGNSLAFSTFYGGSTDDGAFGIDLDAAGNIYVTGFTFSANFRTLNPFQLQNRGGDDAFILKITPAFQLAWASFLGGTGDDRAFDLAVDTGGNSYITGRTESTDFNIKDAIQPVLGAGRVLATALNQEFAGAESQSGRSQTLAGFGRDPLSSESINVQSVSATIRDAFVAKIDTNGNLIYSTFLGGSAEEKGFCIAVDNRGSCYVAGLTESPNFPTKIPYQKNLKGILDAFIARIADVANTQTTVSAASYLGTNFAPESIVAAFGGGMSPVTASSLTVPLPTSVNGVSVQLRDSTGKTASAPILYLSPVQLNYLIPKGLAGGPAKLAVWDNGVLISAEEINITNISPGIFSANADGKGLAAASALRVKADGSQIYESIIRFDSAVNRYVAIPIDLGAPNSGDTVYLVLYATGIRYRSSLSNVVATLGGESVQTTFAGPQPDYEGLDQINILLPRSIAGRGEVNVDVNVDGKNANTVKVSIK